MTRVKACPSDLTLDLPLVLISSVSYPSHCHQPFNTGLCSDWRGEEGCKGWEELRIGECRTSAALRQAPRQLYLLTSLRASPEVPGSHSNLPLHSQLRVPRQVCLFHRLLPAMARALLVMIGPSYLGCFPQNRLLWGGEAAKSLHGAAEPFLCPFPSLRMFLFHSFIQAFTANPVCLLVTFTLCAHVPQCTCVAPLRCRRFRGWFFPPLM